MHHDLFLLGKQLFASFRLFEKHRIFLRTQLLPSHSVFPKKMLRDQPVKIIPAQPVIACYGNNFYHRIKTIYQ